MQCAMGRGGGEWQPEWQMILDLKRKFWLILICMSLNTAMAKTLRFEVGQSGRQEIEVQLDAYYSALDYIVSLTRDSIPRIARTSEANTYAVLARSFLRPRFMLLEASLNPMPALGSFFYHQTPNFYESAEVADGLNLIQVMTEAMPEPWALSAFWGGVMNFYDPAFPEDPSGKGYSGLLLSGGNYHILNNRMIPDYWLETEAKLKGTDITVDRKLSWSFRIGMKFHEHQQISNSLYAAIKRDRVDLGPVNNWKISELIMKNSEIEFRMDTAPEHRFRFSHFTLLGGKKWPFESGKYVFSLGLGMQLKTKWAYSGKLRKEAPDGWNLVVRPNLEF